MQSPRLSIYILVFKRVHLRGKSVAFFSFYFLALIMCVDWGVEMICPSGAVEQSRESWLKA